MTFADVNNSCYLAAFFCFAMLETLLCSGITYGWASIVYVFKTEFFYMHLCEDWYAKHNQTMPTSGMHSWISAPVRRRAIPITKSLFSTAASNISDIFFGTITTNPTTSAAINISNLLFSTSAPSTAVSSVATNLTNMIFSTKLPYSSTPATAANITNMLYVRGGTGFVDDEKLPGCPAQDARLNLVFTISLFCLCGIKFPAGVFIDRCGPRIARVVGGLMYIVACFGLGFVSIGYENLLFPVFALICMGGSLLVVSVYQVANIIFRKSRSNIICILHGAFDSSAVMLLVFKMIYDQGIRYRYIMFGYTFVCFVLIVLGTFCLVPKLSKLFEWIEEESRLDSYYNARRDSICGPDFVVRSLGWNSLSYVSRETKYGSTEEPSLERKRCLTNDGGCYYSLSDSFDGTGKQIVNKDDSKRIRQEIDNELFESNGKTQKKRYFSKGSVLNSILSPLYLFELVYLIGFQLKLWYFVGAMTDFLGRLTLNNKTLISEYVDIFGYVQFGGIFVTPLIGLVFEKDRLTGKGSYTAIISPEEQRIKMLRGCIAPFAVTNILCMIFCVVSMVESLQLQILSFVLYTVVRGFLYSNHGAYMGAAFPANQFGTLYGLGIFIGGTFGILQYVLFKITSGPLKGDPFWVNMFLFGIVTVGNIHPLYLWWYCRKRQQSLENLSI